MHKRLTFTLLRASLGQASSLTSMSVSLRNHMLENESSVFHNKALCETRFLEGYSQAETIKVGLVP